MQAPDGLLSRVAAALRADIGPAVADAYPRTQAFMAAVVLDKLAGQLRNAQADATADAVDQHELAAVLRAELVPADPAGLRAAVEALEGTEPVSLAAGEALHRLVTELYAIRAQLGEARFSELLGLVRPVLRARLDRRLRYAA
jgi:hypothetical protein